MLNACLRCELPWGVVIERSKGLCNRCESLATLEEKIIARTWRAWEKRHGERAYAKALERIATKLTPSVICEYTKCTPEHVRRRLNDKDALDAEHNATIRYLLAGIPYWQWNG